MKKNMQILLRYRQLFVKGNVFIGERGIFGAEVFLHYRQFFIKSNFVIGGVEYIYLATVSLCFFIYMCHKVLMCFILEIGILT